MERNREHWYERTEVKKITADWVKLNCKLTEREQELLQLVYDRKLVRRDHLETISPSYRKLGVSKTRLLNRAIKKLYKNMVLDKAHEKQDIGKGNNPCIVAIDRAGSLMLGVTHKRRIIHKASKHKGKEYISRYLPSNVQHINGVNQIEVETIIFCEENEYEILEWQLEQSRVFNYNDEKIILIPDVLMILDIKGKRLAVFIEYDTGSEGLREKKPKIVKEKLIKYKRYRSSNLWENEEWQKHFEAKVFPLLLFVTSDYKRVEYWNKTSKELGVKSVAMYIDKYVDVLSKLVEVVGR
ncbi:replication-relaxation family protein [Bacillus sp. FJAT-22090]|uniref:replication-relaxation family protein n=1 Tax=Bacillus sp. FJAT-22090 TaxID=1581038 RepID=UPI0011A16A4A|nr:replication-relaxation family protein [Bacillus sp. FJAT-22090]